MSEQTEGAEVEREVGALAAVLSDPPLSPELAVHPWGEKAERVLRSEWYAQQVAAAEVRGAKVVLNALADRLDFWDGRPWEGEESTNDILTFCERAFAAAARGVEGGAR
jgi:hypothetical protein